MLFSYTVQAVDRDDDDGVGVVSLSLALSGGTIQATDNSANAVLTFSAITFANHKVNTVAIVSSVAITSSSGIDNTYVTGDPIIVSLTFNNAVTVTGTPRVTLDIGGTERTADYSGVRTATGQLLFSYAVLVGDADTDGVALQANSLALNGGTIKSTDDATDATLTHSAMTFTDHKVDTELVLIGVLIGNMDQADGTALRINAGESVRLSFLIWNSSVIYDLNQIVLDVKTPSDTLNLTVSTRLDNGSLSAKFTGSVAAAGRQTFRSNDFTMRALSGYITQDAADLYLTATGTGYVELGTTASTAEDAAGAYRWSIGDSVYKSTDGGTTYAEQTSAHIPRFNVVGHTTETLRVLAADVVSEPYNGTAYAAGEHIEVRIIHERPSPGSCRPPDGAAPAWRGRPASPRCQIGRHPRRLYAARHCLALILDGDNTSSISHTQCSRGMWTQTASCLAQIPWARSRTAGSSTRWTAGSGWTCPSLRRDQAPATGWTGRRPLRVVSCIAPI